MHHRHITGGAPLVAAHVPGISNMAQLYNPAQPHTGIGLTAIVPSNQPHKLAANDVGLLRRTLSPERRLSGHHHHGHAEVHRRSMTGQLERGIGLLNVDTVTPQDKSLRPDNQQHRAMRQTQSSGGGDRVTLTFPDSAAAGHGDIGSLKERRHDMRLRGRGPPTEPLRVDTGTPGRSVSFTAGSSWSRKLTSGTSQIKPVSVDIRARSRQDSNDMTLPDKSGALDTFEHSQMAGGDCVRTLPESHLFEDASKSFVAGVKSGVHRGGPKPAVVPSIPVAIKTGTKEAKEAKDSKTTGSKK